MGIYYRIWMDLIVRLWSKESTKKDWQLRGIIGMSIAMMFNFITLMLIFQKRVLGYYFYELDISLLSDYENYIVTILFLYFLPCIIVNYLLIFRGKRYEKFIGKYPYQDGNLFYGYFIISLALPIILLWIIVIFQ
jgi:hypothetical protein